MLSFEDKVNVFKSYLEKENENYSDIMKNEIYFYFFENESDLKFLNVFKSKLDIENKVEQVVSRMVLHEHEDELKKIIFYQFYG